MSVFNLRQTKGSRLTHAELDANFTNLEDTSDATRGDALVGGKLTDTGATAFTLHEYSENRSVNVKTDFGATGDGSTDDYSPIQRAIDAMETRGGGDVVFPQPTAHWKTATRIDVPSGVRLVFLGSNDKDNLRNYIKPTSAVSVGLRVQREKGVGLINVGLDMANMADGSSGIQVDGCWFSRFDRTYVHNVTGANSKGFDIKSNSNPTNWGIQNNIWTLCGVNGDAGIGFYMLGLAGNRVTAETFINCFVQQCATGWDMDELGSGVFFINCGSESNTGDGVVVRTTISQGYCNWIGGEVASNGGWGFSGTGSLQTLNTIFSGNSSGNYNTSTLAEVISQTGSRFTNSDLRTDKTFIGGKSNQTVTASDTISPSALVVRLTAAGAITMTSDPQISNGSDSQLLILAGSSNTNTVTIVDGQGLRLSANCTLGLSDTLTLVYHADAADWIEIARSNN